MNEQGKIESWKHQLWPDVVKGFFFITNFEFEHHQKYRHHLEVLKNISFQSKQTNYTFPLIYFNTQITSTFNLSPASKHNYHTIDFWRIISTSTLNSSSPLLYSTLVYFNILLLFTLLSQSKLWEWEQHCQSWRLRNGDILLLFRLLFPPYSRLAKGSTASSFFSSTIGGYKSHSNWINIK